MNTTHATTRKPTLSEWAMLALVGFIALAAAFLTLTGRTFGTPASAAPLPAERACLAASRTMVPHATVTSSSYATTDRGAVVVVHLDQRGSVRCHAPAIAARELSTVARFA